jgi:hypothetical protein
MFDGEPAEPTRKQSQGPDGRTIGLNILNAGNPANPSGSTINGDEAINIQAKSPGQGWNAAIMLEATEPRDMSAIVGARFPHFIDARARTPKIK